MKNIDSWQDFIANESKKNYDKENYLTEGVVDLIFDAISNFTEWVKSFFEKPEAPKPTQPRPEPKPNFPTRSYTTPAEAPKQMPLNQAVYIIKLLIKGGLTLEGASALVGNMWEEGLFNPHQKQFGGGPGRGIVQWEKGARWEDYLNFHKRLQSFDVFWKKFGIFEIEPQVAFVIHELENRPQYAEVWDALTNPGSLREKAVSVLQKYEIASNRNKKPEQDERTEHAQNAYSAASSNREVKQMVEKYKQKNIASRKASSTAKEDRLKYLAARREEAEKKKLLAASRKGKKSRSLAANKGKTKKTRSVASKKTRRSMGKDIARR